MHIRLPVLGNNQALHLRVNQFNSGLGTPGLAVGVQLIAADQRRLAFGADHPQLAWTEHPTDIIQAQRLLAQRLPQADLVLLVPLQGITGFATGEVITEGKKCRYNHTEKGYQWKSE